MTAHEGVIEDDPNAPAGESHIPTRTVVVDVADDGPGRAEEICAIEFSNAFFTTKPQGSGLGLAIVRKMVDARRPDRHSHERPEKGTRFRVTLPVSGADDSFP